MIRVENVSKSHMGRPVLSNVSLHVDEGTNLGLIGPGGAGKTVLLKIITGLIEPDDGRVLFDDVDVHELDETELAELRGDMGMLFQNYALFDFMTVSENIAFPMRQEQQHDDREIRSRVDELLAEIGLPGIGHQYPNELSGGMKKRVSFARAVIQRPPILFYDDPTAGLDPVTSSKIFMLLRKMQQSQGTTSITISHDIGGIKDICDDFAMLERGELVFFGSRAEIEESDEELVRQFWDGTSDDELGS
jgi:phospholipid/cholesterol/gamma-HCH transport system ATP-binding protein